MKAESIDVQNGHGASAKAGALECRAHRQISDLKWQNAIAEAGTIGTKNPEIAELLGNQLSSCVWWADDLSSDESAAQNRAILGLVARLHPRNELEGMLATQAVAIHNAAMECLRHAMIFDASMKTSDIYFKNAVKLCQVFLKQSEVLSSDKRSSWRKRPDK